MCTTLTADLRTTVTLAGRVASSLRPGDVVLLIGDLGAGKTTFAKALAKALGVSEPVTSPTFTLMRHYPLPGGPTLLHLDAYRLDGPAGLDELGLSELLDDGAIAVIEWGDIVAAGIGDDRLEIVFDWVDEGTRRIELRRRGSWSARPIGPPTDYALGPGPSPSPEPDAEPEPDAGRAGQAR